MKKIISITAIIFLALVGCKKEEKKTEPTPVSVTTKTDYLCSSKWFVTATIVLPGLDGSASQDIFPSYQSCTKDDFQKFEKGGFGVSDEGATKCDQGDPQSTAFTWSLSQDEKQIIIDGDLYNIETLNESTFKTNATVDGIDIGGTPGTKYKITLIMKH